jgi:hypothetical protein
MTDIRQIKFDTEELLNTVNILIQSGLNNLVNDFVEKHKIYEETHKGVLNLPSVKKLLFNKEANVITDSDSDSDSENNGEGPTIFVSIKEMTEGLVDEKIKVLEQSIVNSFQVFTSRNMMISQKMLSHIETLNNELKELKQTIQIVKKPVIDLTHESEELELQKEIKKIVDEVIIKEEKENIVLQIVEEEKEDSDDDVEEAQADEDDELDEDSDDEEEETVEPVEEEQVEEEQVEEEQVEEEQVEEESVEPEEQVEEEQVEEESVEPEEQVEEESVEPEEQVEEESVEEESVEPEEQVEEEQVEEESVEPEEQVEEEPQVTPNQDIETEAEESESDEEEEEEEDEKEKHEEDDDDDELFEIEIEDVTYCTNDEENGIIFELTEEGEAGKKVGFLKDGEATFY